MKIRGLFMLLIAWMCLFLSSCTNEDIMEPTTVAKTNLDETEVENTLKFIYKGNLYSSEYTYADADSSDIIVLDKETAKVWKSLGENPNFSAFLRNDGLIEYFDSKEEQNEMINSIDETLTRVATQGVLGFTSVTLNCFKDTGCKGYTITYKVDGSNRWVYDCENLSSVGMNDEISAFRLIGTTKSYPFMNSERVKSAFVDFYQHPNYQGDILTIRLLPEDPIFEEKKLKKVKSPSGGNWNDKISSFKMHCVVSS